MDIRKLLTTSAVLVYLFGKSEITGCVRHYLKLAVLGILAIILLLGALIALSLAAYTSLAAILPAAVSWLLLGLAYALAAAITYIRLLSLSRRT